MFQAPGPTPATNDVSLRQAACSSPDCFVSFPPKRYLRHKMCIYIIQDTAHMTCCIIKSFGKKQLKAHVVLTILGNTYETDCWWWAFLKWQKSNQSHQLTLVLNGKQDKIHLSIVLSLLGICKKHMPALQWLYLPPNARIGDFVTCLPWKTLTCSTGKLMTWTWNWWESKSISSLSPLSGLHVQVLYALCWLSF